MRYRSECSLLALVSVDAVATMTVVYDSSELRALPCHTRSSARLGVQGTGAGYTVVRSQVQQARAGGTAALTANR
jgi:hypothetical protein